MRMRLSLARALLGAPAVLLLDEPTRSLDPLAAGELRSALRTAARDRGLTVVVATHDLHEPAALGARCGLLERGRLVADYPSGGASAELEAALRSADGNG
jgi:ABC-2 type transport system ATP-binding protein